MTYLAADKRTAYRPVNAKTVAVDQVDLLDDNKTNTVYLDRDQVKALAQGLGLLPRD